jgi:pectate lyase
VFNVLGQEVAALVEGEQEAGFRSVVWDAVGIPAGIYFYRLRTREYDQTNKLLLVR